MKLKTSIKNAETVADRIRAFNGIIETPEGRHSCVRIKRAWLFGSTARLKPNPNDTDIILDVVITGQYQPTNCKSWRGVSRRNNAKTDKNYKRSYGLNLPVESQDVAFKYLRQNLKLTRFHLLEIDGEYATDRIMIYPINHLK